MNNTPFREFFAHPVNPYHRRYEALRAVFVDGRSQQEVAEQFGFQYSTLRQLVYEFRQHCRTTVPMTAESLFFVRSLRDVHVSQA